MIFSLVHQHQRRYGGDWDELLSHAYQGFLRAAEKHDPAKGKFTTICWLITRQTLRREAFKHKRKHQDIPLDSLPSKKRFDLIGFMDELSQDSRAILQLLIDQIEPLQKAQGGKRKAFARLVSALGWSVSRVSQSFAEIREALR